jgi:fructuronate reductase
MDGSQKIPQRILGTIAENLAAKRASPGLVLAVAAWMRYVGAVDEAGQIIDVQDPLAELLKSQSDAGKDSAAKVDALLSLREVFPESLAINPLFQNALHQAFSRLTKHGAQACTKELFQ